MRAMTGVRTNQPSSHHMLHNLYRTLPSCPSLSIFILSILLSLPSFLLSLSSLPGITLVDETSPVDEPSDSDQVTEGVKFAYTLPHQQSNQKDSQDNTALVCVHPCACGCSYMYWLMIICVCVCVLICVCTCMYILVCTYVSVCCREYGVYI